MKKNKDKIQQQTSMRVTKKKGIGNKHVLNINKLFFCGRMDQYIGPSNDIMLLKPRYLNAAPAKPCPWLKESQIPEGQ